MTIAHDMTRALEELCERDPWRDRAPHWEMGMPAFEALCRFGDADQIAVGLGPPAFHGCAIIITTKFDGWDLVEP